MIGLCRKKIGCGSVQNKMSENFSSNGGQRRSTTVGDGRRRLAAVGSGQQWSTAAGGGSDSQWHKVVVVNGGEKKLHQ